MSSLRIRPAERRDAAAITILADIAGFGLPNWLWSSSPERGAKESVLAFGRKRVLRDDAAFAWRRAHVVEVDGEIAGMLLGYRQPDAPDRSVAEDAPNFIKPLLELEALAPATWYVNAVAVFEEFQGRGVGAMLLERAETLAAASEARGISLIVEDDNAGAIRLYERFGYRTVDSRPFVPFPGCAPAESWLLMVKALAGAPDERRGRTVRAEGA